MTKPNWRSITEQDNTTADYARQQKFYYTGLDTAEHDFTALEKRYSI